MGGDRGSFINMCVHGKKGKQRGREAWNRAGREVKGRVTGSEGGMRRDRK